MQRQPQDGARAADGAGRDALPSIQRDLGFNQPDLAWVVNAYLIAFSAGCCCWPDAWATSSARSESSGRRAEPAYSEAT